MMFFKKLDNEEVKQLKKELRYIGNSKLLEICNNTGLSDIEETIILMIYGSEDSSVTKCCMRLNISESTFKRHRNKALNKIANYLSELV